MLREAYLSKEAKYEQAFEHVEDDKKERLDAETDPV